eukprot:1975155-Pyramimonas_sp.AAC.1
MTAVPSSINQSIAGTLSRRRTLEFLTSTCRRRRGGWGRCARASSSTSAGAGRPTATPGCVYVRLTTVINRPTSTAASAESSLRVSAQQRTRHLSRARSRHAYIISPRVRVGEF